MDRKEKYKTLNKLHRQFAHPPVNKIKSLLQDAKLRKDDYLDLLENIERKFDFCKRYTKHLHSL